VRVLRSGASITETETVTVAAYLEQNGTGFLGFIVPNQAAFFGAKSLFVAKDLATHCEREPCQARRQLVSTLSLRREPFCKERVLIQSDSPLRPSLPC
jgi:hypothetical protein